MRDGPPTGVPNWHL